MFWAYSIPSVFFTFSGFPLSTGTLGGGFCVFSGPGGSFWGVPNQNAVPFGSGGGPKRVPRAIFVIFGGPGGSILSDFWRIFGGFWGFFPKLAVFRDPFFLSQPAKRFSGGTFFHPKSRF